MRKLVYLIATTIDGFIASAPNENPGFFMFEGPQAADLQKEFPEMIPGHIRPLIQMDPATPNNKFDTVVMGRTTYEIGTAEGITNPYPHLRQIVVSSSYEESPDSAIEVWPDEARERMRALKTGNGADIWLCGGGNLAATLIDDIDEFILKISPVVLGKGVPLFGGTIGPRNLSMTDHRIYENGFALMRYRQKEGGNS